jgi:ornithine carbamoyltransferase
MQGLKIAWVGDGNNVLHDLMLAAAILGCDVHWAVPKGYGPDSDVVARATTFAEKSGSTLTATNDPVEAVTDADVIYTDVFVSMGEEDMADKMNDFDGFQINDELISYAKDDYLFMHCLPAERGREVTDGVMEADNSIVFDQAENRLHVQNAIMIKLSE